MVALRVDDVEVDRLFQALADATRRDIVARVFVEEHSVSALARQYEMSFAAVQKHVAVLERASLVTKERRGREQLVRGAVDGVRRARRLLDEYEWIWRQRVSRIEDILAEDATSRAVDDSVNENQARRPGAGGGSPASRPRTD